VIKIAYSALQIPYTAYDDTALGQSCYYLHLQ